MFPGRWRPKSVQRPLIILGTDTIVKCGLPRRLGRLEEFQLILRGGALLEKLVLALHLFGAGRLGKPRVERVNRFGQRGKRLAQDGRPLGETVPGHGLRITDAATGITVSRLCRRGRRVVGRAGAGQHDQAQHRAAGCHGAHSQLHHESSGCVRAPGRRCVAESYVQHAGASWLKPVAGSLSLPCRPGSHHFAARAGQSRG